MSVSDILGGLGKIKNDYIDTTTIIIPITNVENLVANLNILSGEIDTVAARQQFSEFYSLVPGSNAAPIPAGGSVEFVSDGPFYSDRIVRDGVNLDDFILKDIGLYKVSFAATIDGAGQLGVLLAGALIPRSVVGVAGAGHLSGSCIVSVTVVNSVLSVVNPVGGTTFSLTPSAGGSGAVGCNLLIEKVY